MTPSTSVIFRYANEDVVNQNIYAKVIYRRLDQMFSTLSTVPFDILGVTIGNFFYGVISILFFVITNLFLNTIPAVIELIKIMILIHTADLLFRYICILNFIDD